jgi:hypothetical protein
MEPLVANHVVEREMIELCARFEEMEEMQRIAYDVVDVSDAEGENIELEE